jgi:transposase
MGSAKGAFHDPYAYLKDVQTQRASEIEQLLPHQWVPT